MGSERVKTLQEATYDAEVIIDGCPPAELSHDFTAIISRWAARGAYRFLVTLRGARFAECQDFLREALQSFLFASFTVREGTSPARSELRLTLRAKGDKLEVIE
ncbi:MAG: hypothetical protein ACP5HT_01740 [Conexivisphaera sp.]